MTPSLLDGSSVNRVERRSRDAAAFWFIQEKNVR
jgi:hypothetical protein